MPRRSSTRTTGAPGQAGVDLEGEGLAGEDIDDAEQPHLPSGGQRILQEIQRPLLVGSVRGGWATAPDARPGLASATPHRQPFLAVQPLDPLVVDDDPFPAQQDVQAAIAEARTVRRQLAEPSAQRRVVVASLAAVADGRPARAHQPTGPALGEPKPLLHEAHGGPPLGGRHQFFRRSSLSA